MARQDVTSSLWTISDHSLPLSSPAWTWLIIMNICASSHDCSSSRADSSSCSALPYQQRFPASCQSDAEGLYAYKFQTTVDQCSQTARLWSLTCSMCLRLNTLALRTSINNVLGSKGHAVKHALNKASAAILRTSMLFAKFATPAAWRFKETS